MQRIALIPVALVFLTGFTRPDIPSDARGVYRFGGYTGAAVKTLDGGLFSVAVGFRADSATASGGSYRDRAVALVDRIDQALGGYDETGVDISVSRIYSTTREVLLTVELRDTSQLERVRSEIIAALKALPDTAFVGEPGKAKTL